MVGKYTHLSRLGRNVDLNNILRTENGLVRELAKSVGNGVVVMTGRSV